MGYRRCICFWGYVGGDEERPRIIQKVMGCAAHDEHRQTTRIPPDADYSGETISRDLNADRVPEATREAASYDASLPHAPAQFQGDANGNACAGAYFFGVLGERPSGRVWAVNYDPASHRVAIAGLGIGFGLSHTDARLLYLELGDAINLRRAAE